ncbi:MAG: ABC transporter ATP-binding protein [Thermodesulfobacteriota bacterium]
MNILEIEKLTKKFSGLVALMDVAFALEKGAIKSLIGPNGAGKTTLFQIISGVLAPSTGRVKFEGRDITRRPAHEICALGVSRTFQLIRLFPNMTVLENVLTGRHIHLKTGVFWSGFMLPHTRREERQAREKCREILEFLGLADRADFPVSALPYGQQRLVEIGRALASEPKIVLLDEPAAGMNPRESSLLAGKIVEMRARGITVFLVEHDMGLVMEISDEVVVLNYGQVIAEGPPGSIQENPLVIEAYLGVKTENALP